MSENIEQQVIEIVANTLKKDPSAISPGVQFVQDLGADSLDLVEVMMALEEAFHCEIPDDKASKITTIAEAVEYIKQNRPSAA